ncbi:MAG: tetratricopeptide repeat protein [Terriglobia bacterium]
MKRTIILLSAFLLLTPFCILGQTPAAKGPQWKSRAEYDAFQAIQKGSTPQEKIQSADAFLEKYPTSDFKFLADNLKAQEYQQLGQTSPAIAAAKDSLKSNPDNLFALNYLSYVFPYTYKPNTGGSSDLGEITDEAKKGLQLLQQQQKPAAASEEQFDAAVKQSRFNFNRALGFAALQQKDYPGAINYLKAAEGDNANDSYTSYFLGQSYLGSNPPDYNNALWALARSVALAKKANDPILSAAQKAYSQWYEYRHGSNAGEQDIVTQASSSETPPSGFNVTPPPKHQPSGNATVDAFYGWQDALSVGGDSAQSAWNQIKGQSYGVLAYVESVQPGTNPDSYVVRADIIPDNRGKAGMYNLLIETNQADAKYLKLGTPFTFKGTISAYTAAPSFVLTIADAQIDQQVLTAAAAEAKSGKPAKPAPRRRPRR